MELQNEFTVSVPVEQAWTVLTDVERVAPCIPGATLEEAEGEEYRGTVRLKVGPITVQYRGTARFVELDAPGTRAVLRAEGRETRGQGGASATISASLAPEKDATRIKIVTDLTVTGRVAQFGRGVLAEVSNKLVQQFVECLETTVLATPSTAEAPAGQAPTPEVSEEPPTSGPPPGAGGAVPVVSLVGPALLKRLAPVLGVVGALILWRRWRRCRRGA